MMENSRFETTILVLRYDIHAGVNCSSAQIEVVTGDPLLQLYTIL